MTMTDRCLQTPPDLECLDFDKAGGLIPVVTQDADTGEVLMVAWADREALTRTLESGEMHYRSRSRDELWRKGATSGAVQRLVALHADCDGDTVLALVRPAGPACHTGAPTCFGECADPGHTVRLPPTRHNTLSAVAAVVEARARRRPEDSYTVRLLDDENLRLKKLGEEATELAVALARGDAENAVREAADLLYHVVVALRAGGTSIFAALDVLAERRT